MTVNEYNRLDEAEQLEIVWASELIGTRTEGDVLFELYKNEDLFIEVQSSVSRKNYLKFQPMLTGWN